MRAFDLLRLHLTLAVAGALLLEWLHRQLAAAVVALIAVDLVVATFGHPRRRDGHRPPPVQSAAVGTPSPPQNRRVLPRPIALKRALGADCPSCRGFGCGSCAYTGLN